MNDLKWSNRDKQIARQAFKKAYEAECAELLEKVREMADGARQPSDLWQIHDFLDRKRGQIDEKYDYRYSVLVQVFARLVAEDRLTLDDLDGLGEDVLSEIRRLVQLARGWAERGQKRVEQGQ
ncbi:MAG: hypothetical protein ABFD90_14255 [Phycisphaerales bacterium]